VQTSFYRIMQIYAYIIIIIQIWMLFRALTWHKKHSFVRLNHKQQIVRYWTIRCRKVICIRKNVQLYRHQLSKHYKFTYLPVCIIFKHLLLFVYLVTNACYNYKLASFLSYLLQKTHFVGSAAAPSCNLHIFSIT